MVPFSVKVSQKAARTHWLAWERRSPPSKKLSIFLDVHWIRPPAQSIIEFPGRATSKGITTHIYYKFWGHTSIKTKPHLTQRKRSLKCAVGTEGLQPMENHPWLPGDGWVQTKRVSMEHGWIMWNTIMLCVMWNVVERCGNSPGVVNTHVNMVNPDDRP